MEIVHRIALTASQRDQADLADLGFPVGSGFVGFDVAESDEAWPAVRRWIAVRHPSDFPRTTFSEAEIAAARWLVMLTDWHHGYPQPHADSFGYRDVTYDLTEYCPRCGIGFRQKAPFQMTGEPRWGRRAILQLNWVFEEYFVTPALWAEVFRPRGVACRPVTNRRGTELATVVQLVVEEEVSLAAAALPAETCGSCGRLRYLPVQRGPLPPLAAEPACQLVRTREHFGSGASASRAVITSQELARAVRQADVRGASFDPLAASADEVIAGPVPDS